LFGYSADHSAGSAVTLKFSQQPSGPGKPMGRVEQIIASNRYAPYRWRMSSAMAESSKSIWGRIAERLNELGRAPRREENLPQWLLEEVLRARDPQLRELAAKLMSQGFNELQPEERDALFRAIVGEKRGA
jgi:hypothetical protein